MTNLQKNYIDFVESLKQQAQKVQTLNLADFAFDELGKNIKHQELLVPVVGDFSAGKSTLLNSLLGKDYLSTNTAPETALATELRYSIEEYIEGVKSDGSTTRFELVDSENIKNRASEFEFLRFYINQNVLKEIQPLILVDMPGFEAPIKAHNNAILRYLEKGVYFIVLQAATAGNITSTLMRELENIKNCSRDFTFFISKTNLKPQDEVDKVKDYVQQQLSDYLDYQKPIALADDNAGEILKNELAKISVDSVIKNLFLPHLQKICGDLISTIGASINALKNDKEKNSESIAELEDGLQSVIKEKEKMIAQAQSKYSDNSVNRIINNIKGDLYDNIEEIAQSCVNGSGEHTLNSIIKNSVIKHANAEMADISESIASDMSISLEKVIQNVEDISTSPEIEKFTNLAVNTISKELPSILTTTAEVLISKGGFLKVLGQLLSKLHPALAAIVPIVLAILPGIIGSFFKERQKERQLDAIRSTLISQVIPQIIESLRTEISVALSKQVQDIIAELSDSFAEQIKQRQDALVAAQEQLQEQGANIDELIAQHTSVLNEIENLINKI